MKLSVLENIIEIEFEKDNEKYMIIYKNKIEAQKNKDRLKDRVKKNSDLNKYLKNIDYKVLLNKEDLLLINEASFSTPPIYNMALKTGVDQLIIIN